MIKQTGKYLTETDTGERYVVLEFQDWIDASTKDGPDMIPGMKELRLESGGRVNYIDEDTFEIVANKTVLKRVR